MKKKRTLNELRQVKDVVYKPKLNLKEEYKKTITPQEKKFIIKLLQQELDAVNEIIERGESPNLQWIYRVNDIRNLINKLKL